MTDYLFDAGPQGATISATNQPGISLVNPASAATFDTAMGLHGMFGALITAQPSASGIIRIASNAASDTQAFTGVVTVPDTTAQPMTIMTFRHSSGVVFRILKTTDGRFTVSDSANQIRNITAVGAVPVAAGAKYRVEARAVSGSTTAGRIRISIYSPADGSSPIGTIDFADANTTTNQITGGDLGDTNNAHTDPRSMGWEDVRMESGRTTEFGPYVPVVPVTPQATAVPIAQTSNAGGWAGAFTDVADSSDATYVESPAAPVTDASVVYRLGPLVVPATFSLTVKHILTASGTNTAKVRLKQGATVRKEWTVTPTTAAKTDVLTMTSAEIATVTDWTALDVELLWSGS